MPVPTLFELARQRLIQNITLLTDVGDIPYSFLESILRHIQNPIQLQDLEENCPQIRGETGALWLRFIKRDIPDYATKPHEPRDPENWSKVYRKLKKDAEREKYEQGEALKEQMRALQNDRAQNKTLIVDSKVGYGSRPQGFAFGGRSWGLSGAPAKTGQVGMDKLRRGMFDRNRERPKAAQMPAHVLAQRKKYVQAPERMVRMEQNANEGPRTMVVSKQASVLAAGRAEGLPSLSKPNIKQRPIPQQSTAPPPRASLPAGQQFHAPKLKQSHEPSAVAPPKRKKEEANLFHQPKRRRV